MSDLEHIKIGATRRKQVKLGIGHYPNGEEAGVHLRTPHIVDEIEVYQYAYPILKQALDWRHQRYDWVTAVPAGQRLQCLSARHQEDLQALGKRPLWLRRFLVWFGVRTGLLKRPSLPEAVVVSEESVP